MTDTGCKLDREPLNQLLQKGGRDLAVRMVEVFLEYVPDRLQEAVSACKDGDNVEVAKAVHPIKSSAAYVGATVLRELAIKAERVAQDGKVDEMVQLVGQMQDELPGVIESLRSFQEEISA